MAFDVCVLFWNSVLETLFWKLHFTWSLKQVKLAHSVSVFSSK